MDDITLPSPSLIYDKESDLFKNVVLVGRKRYYIEDLTKRDYSLENTTPFTLEVNGRVFESRVWGDLLTQLLNYLIEAYPDKINADNAEKVVYINCPWTKADILSKEARVNYKKLNCGLYVNCNHTALHSCWLIQDMLDVFGIDKSWVKFLIHRSPSAEPIEIRNYIEENFKKNFIAFIVGLYNESEEYARKVVKIIDKYLTPILKTITKSYNNFYLFDEYAVFSNYSKKVKNFLTGNLLYGDALKTDMLKCLEYLNRFYRI